MSTVAMQFPAQIMLRDDSTLSVQPYNIMNKRDVSDGYHTFDELYDHRAALFAALCSAYPRKAWKARLHHDGTMYDGHFIAGLTTKEGDITYHFEERRWDMFRCKVYNVAPHPYDGATPDDVLKRIQTLVK